MLKLLSSSSSSCLNTKLHTLPALRSGPTEFTSPLLKALSSLRGLTLRSPNLGPRAFFCSDSSGDGSDQVVHVEGKATDSDAEEVESKSSSAIVPTNPRPEDYLTVGFFEKFSFLSFCLVYGKVK